MDRTPSEQWDREAATFDAAADHGLGDSTVRSAWQQLLLPLVGTEPLKVADLGCGTGSLSLLLAEAGHQVHGVDFSEKMLRLAAAKAAGTRPTPVFTLADAGDPPLAAAEYDVVLSRHVLWALPDPAAVLVRWLRLLKPAGRLILVEGRWSTGAGLTAAECSRLVRKHRAEAEVRPLDDPALWGQAITDERYLLLSRH